MTDPITWLAVPKSVGWAGHSIWMSRELAPEELAARITESAHGPRLTARPVGELTAGRLDDLLDEECGWLYDGLALRHGREDGWSFAVAHGGWPGEFRDDVSVSRGGAHVFHLEYEEENGKPVPPTFAYAHDGAFRCGFNLHLDASWGYDGVDGDPTLARRVEGLLAAAGLADIEELESEQVHRGCLDVLGQLFGLTLPHRRITEDALASVVLELAD
ncbi:hypothetical protein ACGFZL_15765 [Streptomyces sp. NPDC048182]|uniref:hypothetical protein n=1 Tax=Streptomyces sp. NPDC048182 TaxID=3365507 RepID=UPI00371674C4